MYQRSKFKSWRNQRRGRNEAHAQLKTVLLLRNFRWGKLHIPEKEEVFNFNSQQQKVQRFYLLTGTRHHVIVSGDLFLIY